MFGTRYLRARCAIGSLLQMLRGEWTLKPVETLKTEVASIISGGGLPSIGDQIYPSGKLEVEFYNRLKEVFSWLEEREEWLLGSESVKDVAVLNSTTTNRVREILLEEEMDASSRGAHRAFVDGKVNEKILGAAHPGCCKQ